jgi:hypothetical protein
VALRPLPEWLAGGEFFGALGGAFDGFDEGDAEAAFFEFEDAVDGAAGRGGDLVFEQGGVVAGFEDHFGGAESGLGGEQGGDVAGQADVDAGFGEGLDDDVEEGWAGAGEAGDGVHVLLVDDDGATDGGEDALGDGHLGGLDEAARAEGGDGGGEHGGGVGHGADDSEVAACGVLDGAGFDRGGEGEQHFGGVEGGGDFGDEGRDLGGLDAEQDDVRGERGGEVIGGDFDAELGGEREGAVGVLDGGDDLVRQQEVVFEEGLEENAAHFAGAEDGDAEVGEHGGGGGDLVCFFLRTHPNRLAALWHFVRSWTLRVHFVVAVRTMHGGNYALAWFPF